MSTACAADADATAAALRDAGFVRLVPRRAGDAVAAAGLLARACHAVGVPFQVRARMDPTAAVDDDGDGGDDRDADPVGEDETVVLVGVDAEPDRRSVRALGGDEQPASRSAAAVLRAMDARPPPVLGLAGVVAAGEQPGPESDDPLLASASDAGVVQRRAGIAVPTADLAEGLATSTLLHAPFSGDAEASAAMLAELDPREEPAGDDRRRLASLVALETVTAPDATERAAHAVDRALRPYATPKAPFATLGGYADVLGAAAREHPDIAVGLGLGAEIREQALETWRDHATVAHRLVSTAEKARHQGLTVARVDAGPEEAAALPTAARLVRDFRATEPVALVVGDGVAAAASVDPVDLGGTLRSAARDIGGSGGGTATTGRARFETESDAGDGDFIDAVRGAL